MGLACKPTLSAPQRLWEGEAYRQTDRQAHRQTENKWKIEQGEWEILVFTRLPKFQSNLSQDPAATRESITRSVGKRWLQSKTSHRCQPLSREFN